MEQKKELNAIDNFDDNNLNAIKENLECENLAYIENAYTMTLSNSQCKITVTEKSRDKFTDILFG